MKKLLLGTVLAGLAFSAAPAHAGIDLEVGGFFRGYGVYVDQNGDANEFDFVRDTELHFTGETTLDNGLTVGAHIELEVDGGDGNSASEIQESYAYFSGAWGRINFGKEDGAAYLLQVAAPSADSNVDGLRAYIDGVNEVAALVNSGLTEAAAIDLLGNEGNFALDYAQDATRFSDKITYLSPVVNGFQLGASFTPDDSLENGNADMFSVGEDNDTVFGAAYEVAARFEGEFEGVGITTGAGYSIVEIDAVPTTGADDDRAAWNAGLDLDFGPIGVGVVYIEDDFGEGDFEDEEKLAVGIDYTTGPFKLGASYLDAENVGGVDSLDAERYTGGVTYTYGPGMTLRGSVSYVEYDADVAGTEVEQDATSFLIGTQVKF